MHALDELLADAGDRDVVDVNLFVAHEREQKVERPAVVRDVDDKARRARAGGGRGNQLVHGLDRT